MRWFCNYCIKQEIVDIDEYNVVQYICTLGTAEEHRSVTEPDRSAEYGNDSLYRLTFETFFSKSFYKKILLSVFLHRSYAIIIIMD